MSSSNQKQIVKLLKSQGIELFGTLKSQGYTSTTISPGILKKNPEIYPKLIFKKGRKTHMFFIDWDLYVPDSLEQEAEKNEDLLRKNNVELTVLVPFATNYEFVFPKQEDIKKTILRKSLGLCILQGGQIKHISSYDIGNGIPKITKAAKTKPKKLQKRIKVENKHIPKALCQAITSKMKNLAYAGRLKDYIALYERSKIPRDFPNEYELVLNLMQKVVKVGYVGVLEEVLKNLEFLRWIEELLRRTGTRDHLIHSFQVFLLGMLIIDTNFAKFHKWFDKLHPSSSLEATWLLASFLHDIGIPVEKREWINSAYTFIPKVCREVDFFCEELGRYYRKCSQKTSHEAALRSMLKDHSSVRVKRGEGTTEPDHGVASALTLMASANSSLMITPFDWNRIILPAAFAMAIHNRRMLEEMSMHRLLPLNIETFPIASLLVICDHIQGFGRPGRSDDPHGETSILFDAGIKDGKVTPKIWFKRKPDPILSKSDAVLSRWWLNEILQKCVTSKEIHFEIQPFI